jgi:hypothetical protein
VIKGGTGDLGEACPGVIPARLAGAVGRGRVGEGGNDRWGRRSAAERATRERRTVCGERRLTCGPPFVRERERRRGRVAGLRRDAE